MSGIIVNIPGIHIKSIVESTEPSLEKVAAVLKTCKERKLLNKMWDAKLSVGVVRNRDPMFFSENYNGEDNINSLIKDFNDDGCSTINSYKRSTASFDPFKTLSLDITISIFSYLLDIAQLSKLLLVNHSFLFTGQHNILWKQLFYRKKSKGRNRDMTSCQYETEQNPQQLQQAITWVCSKCHLTQAFAHSLFCEMCQSRRPERISTVPTPMPSSQPHVIVRSKEHFSKLVVLARRETEVAQLARALRGSDIEGQSQASSFASVSVEMSPSVECCNSTTEVLRPSEEGWYWHVAMSSHLTSSGDPLSDAFCVATTTGSPEDHARASMDADCHLSTSFADTYYYFCLKHDYCEKACCDRWEESKRGWEWVRAELRGRLKAYWGRSFLSHLNIDALTERVRDSEYDHEIEREKQSEYLDADAMLSELRREAEVRLSTRQATQTLRRALRKLFRRSAPLCYESLQCELDLQAEAIARDIASIWSHLNAIYIPNDEYSYHLRADSDLDGRIPNDYIVLFLRVFVRACKVYLHWVSADIEDNSSQVASRVMHCNSVSDMARLSLRNKVIMWSAVSSAISTSVKVLEAVVEEESFGVNSTLIPETFHSIDDASRTTHITLDVPNSGPCIQKFDAPENVPTATASFLLSKKRKNCIGGGGKGSIALTSFSDGDSAHAAMSPAVDCLLQMLELFEEVDVPDDTLANLPPTRIIVRDRFTQRLRSVTALAAHIRHREQTRREYEQYLFGEESIDDELEGRRAKRARRSPDSRLHYEDKWNTRQKQSGRDRCVHYA